VLDEKRERDAEERRALERLAYGRPKTQGQALEAQRALRVLISPDRTERGEDEVEEVRPPESTSALATEPSGNSNPPPRRGRAWALGIGLALVVGSLSFAAGHAAGARTVGPKAGTTVSRFSSDIGSGTGKLEIGMFTVRQWFGTKQRAADKLPRTMVAHAAILDLSTSRLAAVDRNLDKLWVVKERAPGKTLCLVSQDQLSATKSTDLACATASEIAHDGLTFNWTGGEIDWNSMTLTIQTDQ
jgi:hypothetical protein